MSSETRLGRLTRWFEPRPTSMAYWEVVVTDRRLVWCFVGESYRAMLLRADVGERDRAALDEYELDALPGLDAENFTIPVDDLLELRLVPGSWWRRERLRVRWIDGDGTESCTLYRSRAADSQVELLEELADDSSLDGVEVGVDAPESPIPGR